jgi:hypothetical protein
MKTEQQLRMGFQNSVESPNDCVRGQRSVGRVEEQLRAYQPEYHFDFSADHYCTSVRLSAQRVGIDQLS